MKTTPATPADGISPGVQRQLDRLRLRASRWIPGQQAGGRPGPRTRPAFEFIQHRKYVPGDDIRFVDWRASARSEHIYLREGENPQAVTLYLLVDLSASMGWGDPAKYPRVGQIATLLAYVALANGDRCMLLPYRDGLLSPIGPLRGKSQIPLIPRALGSLAPGGAADLYDAVRQLQNRFAPRGGILMVLSDLLGLEDLEPVLDRLPNPRWEVTLLHILHPEELAPTLQGDYIFEDVETGQVKNLDVTEGDLARYREHVGRWLRQIELTCRLEKAFYLLLRTDWDLETTLLPRLREEKILVPR